MPPFLPPYRRISLTRVFSSHSPRKSAFSLVEILVVLAIVALILTISAPALISSFRGAAVNQAGNVLFDLASQARQMAVAKNTSVALVITTDKPPGRGQAAAVVVFDRTSSTWDRVGAWQDLPSHVDVKCDEPGETLERMGTIDLRTAGRSLSTADFGAFVFYPEGRMESENPFPRLIVSLEGDERPQTKDIYQIQFSRSNSVFRIIEG